MTCYQYCIHCFVDSQKIKIYLYIFVCSIYCTVCFSQVTVCYALESLYFAEIFQLKVNRGC